MVSRPPGTQEGPAPWSQPSAGGGLPLHAGSPVSGPWGLRARRGQNPRPPAFPAPCSSFWGTESLVAAENRPSSPGPGSLSSCSERGFASMTRERPGGLRLRTAPPGFPASPHPPRGALLWRPVPQEARGSPIIPADQGRVSGWASAPLPGFSGLLALPALSLCSLGGSESRGASTLPGQEGHSACTEPPDLMPAHLLPVSGRDSALSSEGVCRG